MTENVAPARQCTLPTCSREKADPSERNGLCDKHAVTGENTAPEGGSTRSNPTPEVGEIGSTTSDTPEIEHNVFPEDLKALEQWHTWKETKDGRKVPRAPYENPDWPDKFVSAQDSETGWIHPIVLERIKRAGSISGTSLRLFGFKRSPDGGTRADVDARPAFDDFPSGIFAALRGEGLRLVTEGEA